MGTNNEHLTDQVNIEKPEEEDKYKAEIISTAAQLAQRLVRDELDKLWQRLQDAEAQIEINTKTNARTLGIVRNHVHETIQQ